MADQEAAAGKQVPDESASDGAAQGTRATARSRRKREQIRTGALSVFLSAGFVGSTMDEVAATAGVSKQTLYAYYRSKDELLVDVLSTLLSELHDSRAEVWERPIESVADLRELLVDTAVMITSIALREDYLGLVRVIIAEMPVMPEIAALWRRTVPERGMQLVTSVLRRGKEAGVVGDVDLDLAMRMFMGPILTFVMVDGLARPGDITVPERTQLAQIVDLSLVAITSTKQQRAAWKGGRDK